MDDDERILYDRCTTIIADVQRITGNWRRSQQLINLLSDLVPVLEGGAAEYWRNSPVSYVLADDVITKLHCPAVNDETHAAIVKMTAEWTKEASKLEEWEDRHRG